jgi:hypothetical protein
MLVYFEKRIQEPLTWSREAKKGVGKRYWFRISLTFHGKDTFCLRQKVFVLPFKNYRPVDEKGWIYMHKTCIYTKI